MSASDKALSADFKSLEVQNTSSFNTPTSGTPIPTTSVSSEKTALIRGTVSQKQML